MYMSGQSGKMWIKQNLLTSVYFKAKTDPETETLVLGREKTETKT